MAVTDISPNTVDQLSRSRLSFDGYVLVIGVIAVAALGIARWVWEPSFAQKQQAMQTALVPEHRINRQLILVRCRRHRSSRYF
jgi:hypothetical protein